MANVIKIKRGSGIPNSLEYGEPAFDKLNKKLYIGDENKEPVEISGSESYTHTGTPVNNFGDVATVFPDGFEDVSISKIFDAMFYPYQNPVVNTVTLSPSTSVYSSFNSAISLNSITVKVTAGTTDISEVVLYENSTSSTPVATYNNNGSGIPSGTSSTFSFNYKNELSTTTTYYVKAIDEKGNASNVINKTVSFIYPYYYGAMSLDTIKSIIESKTLNDISTLTQVVTAFKTNTSLTYTVTGSDEDATIIDKSPVLLYPADTKNITKILNANGYDVTLGWTIDTTGIINITQNGQTKEYKFCYLTDGAILDEFKYTFTLA